MSLDQILSRYSEENDRRWVKYLMEEVRKLHEDKKVWISGFLTPYRRQMTEEVFWHHPGTVSYTHLDVYKRQSLYRVASIIARVVTIRKRNPSMAEWRYASPIFSRRSPL